jgi:hypothetical protein
VKGFGNIMKEAQKLQQRLEVRGGSRQEEGQ